jgi:hypothetical protein
MTAIRSCRAANTTALMVRPVTPVSVDSKRASLMAKVYWKKVESTLPVSRCGDKCQALSDLDLFIRSQRENVPIRNITLARIEYKKVLESFDEREAQPTSSTVMSPRRSHNFDSVQPNPISQHHSQSHSRNLRDMMTATRGRRLSNHPLLRAYTRAVELYRDVSDMDSEDIDSDSEDDLDDDDEDDLVNAMSHLPPPSARGLNGFVQPQSFAPVEDEDEIMSAMSHLAPAGARPFH